MVTLSVLSKVYLPELLAELCALVNKPIGDSAGASDLKY